MTPSFLSLDHDVTMLSAFKTPAKARYFFEVKDRSDIARLKEARDFAVDNHLPIVYLGSGTNCLFAFDVFEGLIVKNALKGWEIQEFDTGRKLHAYTAELISPISTALFKLHNNPLFLPWVGLPGTVGGAVAGNAGCFGLEVAQVLESAEVLNLVTWEIANLTVDELEFAYRESKLKGNPDTFVISATFDLDRLFPENEFMTKTPEEMQQIRRSKQPPGLSCGSFFKNPTGNSAGRLIDQAGLKWTSVGGIKISEHHGNFFLNFDHGTWQDVLELAKRIKTEVHRFAQIDLHEEVRIIQ